MKATRTHCGVAALTPVYEKAESEGQDFLPYFKSHLQAHLVSQADDGLEIVFDLKGADAPITNALRRVLIAEVPSVAIETVFFFTNTGIIQDEVLAHRMGMIPLRANPHHLENFAPGDEITSSNTLVFSLTAKGVSQKLTPSETAAMEGEDDAEGRYTKVYSRELEWVPQGDQEETFGDEPPKPVHDDILLAKLGPGQQLKLEAHAIRSIGKDHAKFSPVATASYRLLPAITLADSSDGPFFVDELADELKAVCPKNVFDVEDIGDGHRRAVVARPRDCTVCRECTRDPAWQDRVRIERINDHNIFSIESTGALPARELFVDAVQTLVQKAEDLKSAMRAALSSPTGGIMPSSAAAQVTIAAMRTEPDDLA